MSSLLRRHYVVSGLVQGVGFRYYIRRRARQLALTGWVRNHGDDVEAEAQGPAEQLAVLERIIRAGPPGSQVERVAVLERLPQPDEAEFVILTTV